MNPVSLSASSVTWTTLPALVVSLCVLGAFHWGWSFLERKYFPVADDV